MKHLIILVSSTLFLSCQSRYVEPLKKVIKENFNETKDLNKTKFLFQKKQKVYNLKHNYQLDSIINNLGQTVLDSDIYFEHDYFYSFKTDSVLYYNIARFESQLFLIHQIKEDSIIDTKCFEYIYGLTPLKTYCPK